MGDLEDEGGGLVKPRGPVGGAPARSRSGADFGGGLRDLVPLDDGDLGAVMEAHLLLDLTRAFQTGLPMISSDLAVIGACPCFCSAPHIFCLLPRLYAFYYPFPASSSYPASCPPFPSIGFDLSSCLLISIDACSHHAHGAGLYPRAYLASCWCRL